MSSRFLIFFRFGPEVNTCPCHTAQEDDLLRYPLFSSEIIRLLFYFFLLLCSFLFVRPKRNEPKKKGAGNDNFSLFWQNAFGITLPKKAKVRTISGLPPRIPGLNVVYK